MLGGFRLHLSASEFYPLCQSVSIGIWFNFKVRKHFVQVEEVIEEF